MKKNLEKCLLTDQIDTIEYRSLFVLKKNVKSTIFIKQPRAAQI